MTGLDSAQLCGAGRQRLTGRGAAGACVFVQERSGARRAPPGSVRKNRGEGDFQRVITGNLMNMIL